MSGYTWEDLVWQILVKGEPEKIRATATELVKLQGGLDQAGRDALSMSADSRPGTKSGTGWNGKAGDAFRDYTRVKTADPLMDRSTAVSPVVGALEAAAGALGDAQGKMPLPLLGAPAGRATGGSGDYKPAARAHIAENDAFGCYLSWNPMPEGASPIYVPGRDAREKLGTDVEALVGQWYSAGQRGAEAVARKLDSEYREVEPKLEIKPHQPQDVSAADDEAGKSGDGGGGGDDGRAGGGDEPGGKTGGGPEDTKPKDPEKEGPPADTGPETKPETEPETKPEQPPGEGEPQQPPGEGEPEQPPGEQEPEQPPVEGGPDPYEPEPYEPDPYNPDPYKPPETGLAGAGAGGGGLGGGGGGFGGGGAGLGAPTAAGTGLAAPGGAMAGPGLMAVGGAGAAGGGRGMGGFMPGVGHGGQGGGGGQDSETWLTEDDDPWHSDENTAPPVVGL
ncbi:hypothetical protein AB0I28_33675 [Phytomonospora sp. NPDC050363]|uniref:hypothetical protein n=1 Tax=Phytomonospora sp. NPDC050363 TaxID=3155642 RepID=UPI0033C1E523